MVFSRILRTMLVVFLVLASPPNPLTANGDGSEEISALLATRCLDCHNPDQPQGGLDLSSKSALELGGNSGTVVDRDHWDASLVWQRVIAKEMPPKHPLTDAEQQSIRKWLESGGALPEKPIDRFRFTSDHRAGFDWWSLQPLRVVEPPIFNEVSLTIHGASTENWVANPIDRFILQRLLDHNLLPSENASPRDLLRRLYFDLVGLPPTPEVLEKFAADPSEAAYAKIVDELLNSSHYGERWARHWLDVVRYGESDGFERNQPRDKSWPYRDWVIKSFNSDMPYDRFVRAQLVGDLEDSTSDGLAASGFLVAGVHNTVVGSSDRMQRIARQDELEEILATVGQSFLGLTVQCGRCHDHKFDPISQRDYYQLASAIQGVQHGERDFPRPEIDAQIVEIQKQLASVDRQVNGLRQKAAALKKSESTSATLEPIDLPRPISLWNFSGNLNDSIGKLHGTAVGDVRFEDGAAVFDGNSFVETAMIDSDIRAKTLVAWVKLDALDQGGGAAISLQAPGGEPFDAIVYGEREAGQWMAGSNGFTRTGSFHGEVETEAQSQFVAIAFVYHEDGRIEAFRNGQPYGTPHRVNELQPYFSDQAQLLFGLRHKPAGGNRMLRGRVAEARLYDIALSADQVRVLRSDAIELLSDEQVAQLLTQDDQPQWQKLLDQGRELRKRRSELQSQSVAKIYAITPNPAPGITKLLRRGDVYAEADTVAARGLDAVAAPASDFGLAPDAPDRERRVRLADWIANRANPLLSRVIVNRLWHYHFGRGIVETPNDFGFNGARPTHPELIDWMADQLIKNDMQLKSIHRLIVLSRTYRQSSHVRPDAQAIDSQNRLLCRFAPRRIDAESLHDAMLVAAGQLNTAMGGPGFVDVKIEYNAGTTYYFPIDVDGPAFFRRSIYRFNPRCERSALLETFDCPDPSATAPKRNITTTPLQALSLMNNAFVLRMSNYLAERIKQETLAQSPETMQDRQVQRAWQLTLGRLPDDQETKLAKDLLVRHGLAAVCRGLFNCNEFVVIP